MQNKSSKQREKVAGWMVGIRAGIHVSLFVKVAVSC